MYQQKQNGEVLVSMKVSLKGDRTQMVNWKGGDESGWWSGSFSKDRGSVDGRVGTPIVELIHGADSKQWCWNKAVIIR